MEKDSLDLQNGLDPWVPTHVEDLIQQVEEAQQIEVEVQVEETVLADGTDEDFPLGDACATEPQDCESCQ